MNETATSPEARVGKSYSRFDVLWMPPVRHVELFDPPDKYQHGQLEDAI